MLDFMIGAVTSTFIWCSKPWVWLTFGALIWFFFVYISIEAEDGWKRYEEAAAGTIAGFLFAMIFPFFVTVLVGIIPVLVVAAPLFAVAFLIAKYKK